MNGINIDFEVYRGGSAKELFLQAYQFILWKQCYALIHTVGLPAVLEEVVKDLWALRLQLLKDNVDATSDNEKLFSSQPQFSESEPEDDTRMHKKKLDQAMPSLIDSLGLCYLAMILLRLPVGIGDLHRWAMREDISFIRAIRFVPTIIKQKLPSEYLMALDTTSALELDQIREAVDNLGRFYKYHFDIELPPLNTPLLLFKQIKDLALPISLYPVVRRMAALLSIDFSFSRPGQRQQASSSPELLLMSLLIIAVKLHHPFDNLSRSVASLKDAAVLKMNWSKWTEAYRDHKSRIQAGEHLVRGSEFYISEDDALEMSGEQVDDYLDWYERTWIDEDRARHKTRPLDEDFRKWFPTGRQDGSAPAIHDYEEKRKLEQHSAQRFSEDIVQTMQLRNVTSEKEEEESGANASKIGNHYRRYRSCEELASDALLFHEVAANVTGTKLETLLRAIMQVEERLMKWRGKHFKGQKVETV